MPWQGSNSSGKSSGWKSQSSSLKPSLRVLLHKLWMEKSELLLALREANKLGSGGQVVDWMLSEQLSSFLRTTGFTSSSSPLPFVSLGRFQIPSGPASSDRLRPHMSATDGCFLSMVKVPLHPG